MSVKSEGESYVISSEYRKNEKSRVRGCFSGIRLGLFFAHARRDLQKRRRIVRNSFIRFS